MAVTWVEASVALVLVFARLYGASIRQGELRWDFFWVAVATAFALTSQILLTIACTNGIGQHISLLSLVDFTIALEYFWAASCIAIFGITFAKVAIIALLLALRAPNQKKRGYFLHFLWLTNVITAITITALVYTQCRPIKAVWDITVPHADCSRRRTAFAFTYVQGSWAAVTDILLAIYPIFVVWSLQTTMKMKLGFCVLMSGGLVTALSSALRTYYIRSLASRDFTHSTAHFMIWGGTELWLLIILGSIPPLRPLFAKLFTKARQRVGSSNTALSEATGRQGTLVSTARRFTRRDLEDGRDSQEDILGRKPGFKDGIIVHSTFEMTDMKTDDFVAQRDARMGFD
ncbi:hypothetical protein MBLNU457_3173t2 [Dothideomycetes sp. NU457]